MSRIIFMNVSAAGHVIPTLGLVAELTRRGEEVIYFESMRFKKEVETYGASFRCYPPLDLENAPPAVNEMSLPSSLVWSAQQMLPALLEAVRAEEPDYIIHDSLCLWGKLVAQLLGIPAVNSIATAAFTPQSFYESPVLRGKLSGLLREAGESMKHFYKNRRELREAYNLAPIKFIETFTNPEPLNICYLPPELQPDVEKFDERFHFVGPCNPVREMEYDFSMEQLRAERLILISFGTVHEPGVQFYRSCIEAFAGIDAQVLMLLSPATDISLVGDIPDNFIVRPTGTVPQLKILERARLFIMHGAGGGTREAVWYSVPMIAIPQTHEQEMLSRRIEEQGAGIMLMPEEVNAERLRQTAQLILDDDSFRANSARLGKACRAAGGTERAVDEILRYFEKRRRESATTHLSESGKS